MVLETGKFNSYNLFIDGVKVSCFKEVKLLEITIANQLQLNAEDLYKKASYKLQARRRLTFSPVDKARLLPNSLIHSQFNYAPLIWMFAGKTAISKICKIHYRTLQVVYNNFTNSHDALHSSETSAVFSCGSL